MTAVVLSPEEKLAMARAIVKKKWPYVMASIYGLIPFPMTEEQSQRMIAMGSRPTMFVTQGMVLVYNRDYVSEISLQVLATALVHESQHVLRSFFKRVEFVQYKHLFSLASDLPINSDLKEAGWEMGEGWAFPEKYGFPKGKSSEEYYDMLLSKQKDRPSPGGLGCGDCGAPSPEMELEIDGLRDENGNPLGRSLPEKKSIVRQTLQDVKDHAVTKGRGSTPGWMQELVSMELKTSRIPWQDRLSSVIRDMSGPIISGGDDYSLRHPSKRSYSRKIIRPGLIDRQLTPLFILDTSGSMSIKQLTAGVAESIAVLNQFGIDEAFFCQVDAAVVEEPRRINLSDLLGEIAFKGRGGTDFSPGFRAAVKMNPRPDIIFYWTDGDGWAPRTPCPIPTVWGVVPHSHRTRRPAPWGTVVTITDNDEHPDDDEDNLQLSLSPPAGYHGWDDEEELSAETDMSEYEDED